LSQIEKQFGKGAVMRMGDRPSDAIDAIPTVRWRSTWRWNRRLPRGRVVEVYGPESSGKTTLTLQVVAQAQSSVAHARSHAEHALDPGYAEKLGVTSMTCWFPSRIPANRRWKSPTCWCARLRSTWS
jgi:recombination protein RecA